MPIAASCSNSLSAGHRVILCLLIASVPDYSRAGGIEPRTWTLSEAHTDSIVGLFFSPDGKTMASGGKDTTVRLWNLTKVRQDQALQGHRAEVAGVAFSPDGATPALVGHDGFLRFWDVAGRRETGVVRDHTVKVSKTRE